MSPTSQEFADVAFAGLRAAMPIVRSAQIGHVLLRPDEIKDDDTIVTITDRASQAAAFAAMHAELPGLLLIGEEKGSYIGLNVEPDKGQDGWLVDPTDGTRALALGFVSSTVVIAYRKAGRVVACAIGEPISGRVWISVDGHNCRTGILGEELRRCAVHWDSGISNRSTVFLDVSHGFKGKTTNAGIQRLFGNLAGSVTVLMPGSNGLMQAMVANGGYGALGSITTAKGGPWDLAGGLLVQGASGVIQGMHLIGGIWVECDGLDIDTSEVLICANMQPTLEYLVDVFHESMNP